MKNETHRGLRRWRAVALLVSGALIGITMVATPAGAHLTTSLSHLFKHADARYVNVGEERTTALFQDRPGALPLSHTFRSSGRPLLITASGSGYTGVAGTQIGMRLSIDGVPRGDVKTFANEASSHKVFVTNGIVVTGLASGSHTLSLDALPGTSTDGNDFFTVTIEEFSSALALGEDQWEQNDTRATIRSFGIGFNGPHSQYGTVWPAGDDDWLFLNFCMFSATVDISLVGGPRMDVYLQGGATPLATNLRTFHYVTAPGGCDFFEIRIDSAKAAAYTITYKLTPASARAERKIAPAPNG